MVAAIFFQASISNRLPVPEKNNLQSGSYDAVSDEVVPELSIATLRSIYLLTSVFTAQVQSGSFDEAVIVYERILSVSNQNEAFMGYDYIKQGKIDELILLYSEIQRIQDPSAKSDLFVKYA
jgi:hypothetical protein